MSPDLKKKTLTDPETRSSRSRSAHASELSQDHVRRQSSQFSDTENISKSSFSDVSGRQSHERKSTSLDSDSSSDTGNYTGPRLGPEDQQQVSTSASAELLENHDSQSSVNDQNYSSHNKSMLMSISEENLTRKSNKSKSNEHSASQKSGSQTQSNENQQEISSENHRSDDDYVGDPPAERRIGSSNQILADGNSSIEDSQNEISETLEDASMTVNAINAVLVKPLRQENKKEKLKALDNLIALAETQEAAEHDKAKELLEFHGMGTEHDRGTWLEIRYQLTKLWDDLETWSRMAESSNREKYISNNLTSLHELAKKYEGYARDIYNRAVKQFGTLAGECWESLKSDAENKSDQDYEYSNSDSKNTDYNQQLTPITKSQSNHEYDDYDLVSGDSKSSGSATNSQNLSQIDGDGYINNAIKNIPQQPRDRISSASFSTDNNEKQVSSSKNSGRPSEESIVRNGSGSSHKTPQSPSDNNLLQVDDNDPHQTISEENLTGNRQKSKSNEGNASQTSGSQPQSNENQQQISSGNHQSDDDYVEDQPGKRRLGSSDQILADANSSSTDSQNEIPKTLEDGSITVDAIENVLNRQWKTSLESHMLNALNSLIALAGKSDAAEHEKAEEILKYHGMGVAYDRSTWLELRRLLSRLYYELETYGELENEEERNRYSEHPFKKLHALSVRYGGYAADVYNQAVAEFGGPAEKGSDSRQSNGESKSTNSYVDSYSAPDTAPDSISGDVYSSENHSQTGKWKMKSSTIPAGNLSKKRQKSKPNKGNASQESRSQNHFSMHLVLDEDHSVTASQSSNFGTVSEPPPTNDSQNHNSDRNDLSSEHLSKHISDNSSKNKSKSKSRSGSSADAVEGSGKELDDNHDSEAPEIAGDSWPPITWKKLSRLEGLEHLDLKMKEAFVYSFGYAYDKLQNIESHEFDESGTDTKFQMAFYNYNWRIYRDKNLIQLFDTLRFYTGSCYDNTMSKWYVASALALKLGNYVSVNCFNALWSLDYSEKAAKALLTAVLALSDAGTKFMKLIPSDVQLFEKLIQMYNNREKQDTFGADLSANKGSDILNSPPESTNSKRLSWDELYKLRSFQKLKGVHNLQECFALAFGFATSLNGATESPRPKFIKKCLRKTLCQHCTDLAINENISKMFEHLRKQEGDAYQEVSDKWEATRALVREMAPQPDNSLIDLLWKLDDSGKYETKLAQQVLRLSDRGEQFRALIPEKTTFKVFLAKLAKLEKDGLFVESVDDEVTHGSYSSADPNQKPSAASRPASSSDPEQQTRSSENSKKKPK